MKLTRKISKLASPETYQRSWRKVRRALAPVPLAPLLQKVDHARLREIQARYADSPQNYAKYAEIERWLKRHRNRAQDLQLHRSPPKRILDIGCGGGFFLFIAKHYGHDVLGLDIDDFPMLGELLQLFDVPRKVWRVEAFQPLPEFRKQFDLITAFSTRFNRDAADVKIWGVPEWNFFLDDLKRHLAPGGQVFFEINSGKTRQYYSGEVRDLFVRRGATLERENVFFKTGIV